MKQYLIIAAVLGVIAFASVSFLARADQQSYGAGGALSAPPKANGDPARAPLSLGSANSGSGGDASDGEAESDKAAAAADAAAAASAAASEKYQKDDEACAAKIPQDANVNEAKKALPYRSCMLGKGNSQQQLKAEADAADAAEKGDSHDQGDRAPE